MTINGPGSYALTAEDYHRDPCPEPSLSAHDADALLELSPRHVWSGHPKLSGNVEPFEASADMQFGAAAHAMFAGQGDRNIVWIDAKDWRTNAAKDARADAIRNCKVPLLVEQKARLEAMYAAVQEQAAQHPELAASLGAPGCTERTLVAQDRGVWVRALFDWIPDNPAHAAIDWKITKRGAGPSAYERPVQQDYAVRMHHYSHVRRLVHGTSFLPQTFLGVIEAEEPFGLVLHGCAEDLAEYAGKRWEEAFQLWWKCLAAGTDKKHWPLYPPYVNWVNAAPWQITRWEVELEDMKSRRAGMTVAQGRALAASLGMPIR